MTHPLLTPLAQALTELRADQLAPARFAVLARSQEALLAALPPRYGEVLLGLMDRMEAGALFTEESCSFSVQDLTDSVQLWLDKAEQQLLKT
jgi:hypothetical protein